MPQKINISHKGKTIKFELDSEVLIDKKIGDKISGSDVDESLKGYELEITGTSDKAGFPGLTDEKGPQLRKVLLTYGKGMWNKKKGIRLRKSVRGNQISSDIVQVNIKVLKEGVKKFESLIKPKEGEEKKEEVKAEKPAEKEEVKEPKVEEKKEAVEEKKEEVEKKE